MNRQRRVLVIDDEPAMVEWLQLLLGQAGFEVKTALVGTRGEEIFKTWRPDAVVTDMMLPDLDGISLLSRFKQIDADVEVIVLTGQGNIPRSVEAVKAGAYDFLEKPIDPDLLLDKLDKACRQRKLMNENQQLRQKLQDRYKFENIVGRSKKMAELFDLVQSVAHSEANILIQGENGTGKELIANAIHHNSGRSKGPFIKINCAAIPTELIESELFGYKKGSFTGANNDKEGLFEMAEGGSLLLDEIGEMPPYLQTKLLRVLQERAYRPIGSSRIVSVNFRLICATNVDLKAALKDGRLREDLFFRINTIAVRVPPLRERTDDIPLLADYFMDKFRTRYQRTDVKAMSPEAYDALMRSPWPGNVRELENAIERATLVTRGPEIIVADLPESLRGDIHVPQAAASASAMATEAPNAPNVVVGSCATLAEVEKMAIVQTLQQTNWNKQEAARLLGIYRPTLYSKMRKHEIMDVRSGVRTLAGSRPESPSDAGRDATPASN